ncbi:type II toxin-antitoxin system Phd/YefM family antitoxin [Streptomyces sp. NPDC002553]|uniref:type II toxin-antitoxin system Phd/YefM family antitoxin n=1 Tax=Streptomyces sp. NPDC002553 TaxID=3154417 RepID=UPI00332ADD06
MSSISIREFSHNPSAVLARVERGETFQVTRHGNVIAILSPAEGPLQRYAHLVVEGKIRLPQYTSADRHSMPRHDVPDSVDPLATLLAEREEDHR